MGTSEKHFDPNEIDFLFGDTGSGGGNCPAVLRVPGGRIVQGKRLDAATLAAVAEITGTRGYGTGPDEVALFIPDNINEQSGGIFG